MFDDDSNSKENGARKKPPGKGFNKIPMVTLLAWAGIITATVMLFMVKKNYSAPSVTLTQPEFLSKFASNQISQATINLGGQTSSMMPVNGKFFETEKDGKRVEVSFAVPDAYFTPAMLDKLLNPPTKVVVGAPNAALMNLIWSVAPIAILALLFWFFFVRQIKAAGKGALSFGKSKAKMLAKDRNKTTFKDVAGVEEAWRKYPNSSNS